MPVATAAAGGAAPPRPARSAGHGGGGAGFRAVRLQAIRLPHLLLIAAALRLLPLAVPTVVHPDEVFQYLEPAHRLISGSGVVTWEWRAHIRGWLLPLLLAGPMTLGGALSPGGGLAVLLPRLAMVAASLPAVTVAWRLGDRLSRTHAVAAGLATASWFEAVYYAGHVTSETVAVALVLPAALLLLDAGRRDVRRLLVAGALLGIAVSIRFQYAPAAATLAIVALWRSPRSLLPVAAGVAAGLLPEAIADLAMGAIPYRWVVENVRLNLVAGRAANYGTSGPLGFAPLVWDRWRLWAVPALALAATGARRYPALAAMAVVNLLVHSLIGHKEYRFVLLSVAVVPMLAAIGGIDRAAGDRRRTMLLLLGLVAASASLAAGAFRPVWTAYAPEQRAFAMLRGDPSLCGLALYRYDYSRTPGYTTLARPVPMLLLDPRDGDPRATFAAASGAANVAMTDAAHAAELPPDYARIARFGDTLLYRRPGGCARDDRHMIDRVLARIGD